MFQNALRPALCLATIATILLLFSLYTPTFAQQPGSDPLFIDVQPSAPTPGTKTTITIDSSSVDLSQATIRWSLNGVTTATGSGLRTFTFTMGVAGKPTVVTLSVVPLKGTPFTRNFTFTPGTVLLLWEAATYVPPFFEGKSLYTPGAAIRVVAIPDVRDAEGNPIASSDLNFKWQMDGDAYADHSGLGRDVLDLTGHWSGGVEEIAVDVLRKNGAVAARGALFIKDGHPLIRFYKKDPLRGVLYPHALAENERLTEAETTIVAEPYYISGATRNSSLLQYAWTLNGNTLTPPGNDPTVLTLRQNGGQSGNAVLSLSLQNLDTSKLLQAAEATITLILGTQSSNLFGL